MEEEVFSDTQFSPHPFCFLSKTPTIRCDDETTMWLLVACLRTSNYLNCYPSYINKLYK